MRLLSLGLAAAALFASSAALAGDPLVEFNGAIGVDPVGGITAATGLPAPNTVLGVPPGGRPWILRRFRASIDPDSSINAKGSGLLFSGGDVIGTRGGVAQVFATLFCSGVAHHSPPADLDLQGNFVIKGRLGSVPPSPCLSPVLLIRGTAGAQPWFAAGIPGSGD